MERSTKSGGWLVLICAALTAAITGCAIHYTDVSGMERSRRVVDKATGAGVPEAFVVSQWDENRAGFGANTTFCARLAVVKTGADGRYMIPDWHGRVPLVNRIYKRGYQRIPDEAATNQGVDYLARSTKSGTERIEEVNNYLVRCNEDEDRKLGDYYRALYEEFRAEAPPGREMKIEAEYIHRIDATQFGIDEADRRLKQWQQRKRGGE